MLRAPGSPRSAPRSPPFPRAWPPRGGSSRRRSAASTSPTTRVEHAQLATSELVANAFAAGRPPIRIRVRSLADGKAVVEVTRGRRRRADRGRRRRPTSSTSPRPDGPSSSRWRRGGAPARRASGVVAWFEIEDVGDGHAARTARPPLLPPASADPAGRRRRVEHRAWHPPCASASSRPSSPACPARTLAGRRPPASPRSPRSSTAAEALGYDFCTCSEHVAVPVDVATVRGGTYWDPLAVFGYLAARDQPDPARDVRARARLPPPAGDREALRHARRRERRPAGARRRQRVARGGVRAAGRAVRRPRAPGRRRAPRAARGALAGPPRVRRRVLRVPRPPGGAARDPGPRPDLDRRPHRPLPASRGGARRRVGAVRAPHRRARRSPRPGARHRRRGPPGRHRSRSSSRTTARGIRARRRDRVAEQLGRMQAIGATGLAVRLVHHSLAHYVEQLAALAELAR